MNPLRLLTKGRTIRGLKERPGPYKLLEKSALPNFSGPKRTVPTTPHAEPSVGQSALFEQSQPKPETVAAVHAAAEPESAPALLPVLAPVPIPTPVPVKVQPSKPELWSRLAGVANGWTRKWVPWRKAPPFQSSPVQTELALEKVRVMRNDLSDDDLEVVTMDKKAGTKKPAHNEEAEREKMTAHP
jgi:hypothetical protein